MNNTADIGSALSKLSQCGPEPSLDIIPLGGLGEIGLNCLAIAWGNDIIVVDAGLMFPDANLPGVDLIIPDFSYLIQNSEKVRGIILTHGHEDHIGALAFLLREVQAPIFGTRLTLALTRERLEEYQTYKYEFVEINARQILTLGPFELEFIAVNHSILDGVALAVKTPVGIIIHTGDFKIDHSASQKDRLDLFKFAEYGENGVLALLSDSTNADTPGFSLSEAEVGRALTSIFTESTGRIILACFASSLARIRQVITAAASAGRKIVFDGRSMVSNVNLAVDLGCLELSEDAVYSIQDAQELDDREVVIVVTGSQGEPLSALARMANGEHRQITVQPGDKIIFSARAIPGNEKAITQLVDRFHRLGADVVDNRLLKVHASGHGQIEELRLMLAITRPQYLVPIHGEARLLFKHAELAREMGLAPENIKVMENGQRLSFFKNKEAVLGSPVPTGRRLVDGNRLGEPEDPVLKSRLQLAGGGLVVVIIILDEHKLKPIVPPLINIRGVHYENESDLTLEATSQAQQSLKTWLAERNLEQPLSQKELGALSEQIRIDVRLLFRHSINRKPNVWPQIIVIDPNAKDTDA